CPIRNERLSSGNRDSYVVQNWKPINRKTTTIKQVFQPVKQVVTPVKKVWKATGKVLPVEHSSYVSTSDTVAVPSRFVDVPITCYQRQRRKAIPVPIEDKSFKLEFTFFLVMTFGCETMIGFVLELTLTVLGTFFASLEILSGLILNIPGAITLSLFTHMDSRGVETELEVTGFDKAFVSPILEKISAIGCFANLVFLLKS
nr:hypothetical protein [Tanacetum cinerariifolium]